MVAALKSLVDAAPKPPFASPRAGHHAMLAEMALDRAKGRLDAIPASALAAEYRILMELEELKRGNAVHASGFVRLEYEDGVDGSVQFCRAHLPASYSPAKTWPLVLNLHGYSTPNPSLLVRLPYRTPVLMVPEGEHVFVGNNVELTFHVKEGRCETVSALWPGQPAAVRASRVSPPAPARR